MRHLLALLLSLSVAAFLTAPAIAQDFPERGTAPVVDAANIIDNADEAALSAKLEAFEKRSQRQFVVATIPDLKGYDIADYGYQLGRHWGLGDSENDDGIVLIIAPNERKVRIETGYGIESIIPDGLAYDIIESDILPKFRAGDMTGGIVAGADRIIAQLELPPEEAAAIAAQAQRSRSSSRNDGASAGSLIFWAIVIFFFFILPIIRGMRGGGKRYRKSGVGNVATWIALNAIASAASGRSSGGFGGNGGGGFGGGGGFSGGGGSFGGGGASGGW